MPGDLRVGQGSGAKTVLATCSGYTSQQWSAGTGAELVNATAGLCLAGSGSGTSGAQAWISPCKGKANQKWTQPAGPVVSEVPGACLNDQGGSSADANPVVISSCDGQAAQNWTVKPDGTLRFAGKCLDIPGSPAASGTSLDLLFLQRQRGSAVADQRGRRRVPGGKPGVRAVPRRSWRRHRQRHGGGGGAVRVR